MTYVPTALTVNPVKDFTAGEYLATRRAQIETVKNRVLDEVEPFRQTIA